MASPINLSDGKHWGGCHCSKCMGANQQEGKGKWAEEAQSREVGSSTLEENCYVAKNTVGERRDIANLEKTLQAMLSFVSGGEESDNSPWILCILLGRMIRERSVIGRATKSWAKFQHREIMHGLVKPGDLEDLADPPVLGSHATPPSPQRLQNEEGMQMNAEDNHGLSSGGYLRPEDSPPGTLPPTSNSIMVSSMVHDSSLCEPNCREENQRNNGQE